MTKQLIVNLRPDGTVAAETIGMTGDECLGYITALEDLLDATTTASSYTEDHAGVRAENPQGVFDQEQR